MTKLFLFSLSIEKVVQSLKFSVEKERKVHKKIKLELVLIIWNDYKYNRLNYKNNNPPF